MKARQFWFGVGVFLLLVTKTSAWNYEGHRTVNLLAIDCLPADFPAFVKTVASRERIAFLSGEADRWRNTPDLPLRHVNGPDHFFDMEDTKLYGVDLEHLTAFRYVFVEQLTRARIEQPDKVPVVEKKKNFDRTKQFVGFLPWTILEHYGKVKSGFSYLKSFQKGGGTEEEIRQAQLNIVYLMGLMGHYCGDAAQPLHTTKHFNGWVGENPEGYTTARSFHSWIDGGFFGKLGGIDRPGLKAGLRPAKHLDSLRGRTDYILPVIMKFIGEQHTLVEPLYRMEKDGRLSGEAGKGREGLPFMNQQIVKAAHFLGDLWYTAYRNAPDDRYLLGVLAKRKLAAEGKSKQ
jgi:hypothetical protein